MAALKETSGFTLYSERSSLKWIILAASVVISIASITYSNNLVKKIRERERKQVDLYANTLAYLANENDGVNLMLILEEVIQANNTIPVILTDQNGNPEFFKNLPEADNLNEPKVRRQFLLDQVEKISEEREPIVVTLLDASNNVFGYKYIYYRNSYLLTQLQYYPYIQLSIVAVFGLIIFAIFNYSKVAEQNIVWVGLAKETAHQLGTPLSSLMAWTEYFKVTYPDQIEIFDELQKDVDRLGMITERFSNIGSVPKLMRANVVDVVSEVVTYLEKRISTKVKMTLEAIPNPDIEANINDALIAWVIENVIKNAVDAMGGKGNIQVKILKDNEGNIVIDIKDDGKGMNKSKVKQVFKPGYTSKKRGWGLGLTLAKRIIENYHGGKIFVKATEINKGTTFRVVLRAD
ncbi:MAG: two-component sensor histidine kinase [Cyclobacteriaceae bacterium]